jgi:hypothetical protein
MMRAEVPQRQSSVNVLQQSTKGVGVGNLIINVIQLGDHVCSEATGQGSAGTAANEAGQNRTSVATSCRSFQFGLTSTRLPPHLLHVARLPSEWTSITSG